MGGWSGGAGRLGRGAALVALLAAGGCAAGKDGDAAAARGGGERPSYTAADAPADDGTFHVPQMIAVDFTDGTTKDEFDAWEVAWGVDLERASEEEGVDSAITVGRYEGALGELLARIRAHPRVEAAEPLMRYEASFTPNDPQFDRQWNLRLVRAPEVWEQSRGAGVVVAVLDTGIAYEDRDDFRRVPDLAQTRFVQGYDFVNGDRHANDDHGHGTHVAGTIAQATDNGEGVAGLAFEATLMPVKVLDHFGSGNAAAIADAIRWSVDHGAKVLNLSLGGGGRSEVLAGAVEYARRKGAVVVCAAGNGGRAVVEYPAAYPGALAVGAVGPTGARAPYSSWGKGLDVTAPGGDKAQGSEAGGILQNTIDPMDPSRSVYASFQGTSMATPHVSALAALLFAAGASSPDEVEGAIFASARPGGGAAGWTEQYGHGLVDAQAALEAWQRAAAGGGGRGAEAPPPAAPESARAPVWGYAATASGPLGLAAGLLALVLLTLGRRERQGYLNVLFAPRFLAPLLLVTLGLFFLKFLVAPTELTATLVLPLPDWLDRIIFGRGVTANPLVYSALLPALVALFAVRRAGLRPVAAGVALGFAGVLGYAAWAGTPPLAWMPFTFLAVPWLVSQVLVCLFMARALLRRAAA